MELLLSSYLWMLLALSTVTLAGHPGWESQYLTVAARANDTLEERAFPMRPNPQSGPYLWPNRRVVFCYETADDKNLVNDDLASAWGLWQLESDGFKFEEGSSTECAASNRVNYLLIKVNQAGKLATSVGKIPASQVEPVTDGPTMNISPVKTVGMLDVIANYAHEIGHAWGLYHEQQRPSLWGGNYNPLGSEVFLFNCQNLADYATVMAGISDPDTRVAACTSQKVAEAQKFSAKEFLPLLNRGSDAAPTTGPDATYEADVDAQSIMLYGSGVGGSGSATDPQNDGRAHVITQLDGTPIPLNTVPSTSDIQAIKDLYPQDNPNPVPCLINEPCNPKQSKMKRLIKACKINKS